MAHDRTFTLGGIEFNFIYMVVWAGLLLLTLIEVLIPEMSVGPNGPKELFGITMGRGLSVLLLIGLAVAKTYCVAW